MIRGREENMKMDKKFKLDDDMLKKISGGFDESDIL